MAPSNERAESVASATLRQQAANISTDDLKVTAAKPEHFKGERNKLEDWFNELMNYFMLANIQDGTKQCLVAASYMRGEAQHWIRPKLRAFFLTQQDPEGIFSNFGNFMRVVNGIYGLNNEKEVATRVIQHLAQKTSASQYTAKFKEYSDKAGWDDQALRTMFYRGLKDNVKYELMRYRGAKDTLHDLQQAAIRVDDELYELGMEKRHSGNNRGRSGYVPYSRTGGQRPDPNAMEIDNTEKRYQRKDGKAKGKQQPKGQKKRNGPECYNCHKIGHYARDCHAKKMPSRSREVNVILTQDRKTPTDKVSSSTRDVTGRGGYNDPVPDTDHHQHGWDHWSSCYKDNCRTHLDAKMDAGWFPSGSRKDQSDQDYEDDYDWRYHEARDGAIIVPEEEEFYDVLEEQDVTAEELLQRWTADDDWVMITQDNEIPTERILEQETREYNVIEREDTPAPGYNELEALLKREEVLSQKCEGLIERHHQENENKENFSLERLQYTDMKLAYNQSLLQGVREQIDKCTIEPEKLVRKKPIKEFNMMMANAWNTASREPTTVQTWDDGHHARGRSPPRNPNEDEYLQQYQTPSMAMEEVEQATQDDLVVETSPTTLGEESHSQDTTNYECVELSPEIQESESEEEYSDDNEPDDLGKVVMTIEASNPVVRLMTLISEDAGAVFPVIEGKRRLHPHRFEQLLERMRMLLWNYRKVNVDWDAYSYVVDRPPMGSKFDAKTGGYTAPDGIAISRIMRERVKILKQRFKEIQEIQEKWFEDEIEYPQMKNKCIELIRDWTIVEPDRTLTPVWRNLTLGHVKTTMRGPVRIQCTQGKIVFSPKISGPLDWEVSLENSDSPTYFSKN